MWTRAATPTTPSNGCWPTWRTTTGRVGQWGISYPGFYSAASMIDAHPALRAVSPQAPIADWWYDDFHHHGAFFLPHAFRILQFLRCAPAGAHHPAEPELSNSRPLTGIEFFLDIGPLDNVNELYFKNGIPFWDSMLAHPNYDEFWQSRNLLPHLNNVAPAVLTVGGWFDAEDLYGAPADLPERGGEEPGHLQRPGHGSVAARWMGPGRRGFPGIRALRVRNRAPSTRRTSRRSSSTTS